MVDLIVAAIPAFALLLGVELASYKYLGHRDAKHDIALKGFEARDTRTSMAMGVGNVVTNVGLKALGVALFAACTELSPWRIEMNTWWSWVVLLVAFDFLYYWDHRFHHRVRLGWASHVVHHSSQHFNLSTALRQPWTQATGLVFFVPLALAGYSPGAILTATSIDLLYQFWIHTERINRLPRPLEFIFNTPSHHRVHHGSDDQYLDRNYAGILIIWDRMFGSFASEGARPTYGLTKNIDTFNPVKVAFHEWVGIAHDVRAARSWRDRLGYMFGPPGWAPRAARNTGGTDSVNATGQ